MKTSYNRRLVFWGACAGMLLFGICFITLGSVTIHLKAKFGFSDLQIGSLFAILPLGIITGSLFFGPVVDRNGYKWLLFASSLALAIGFYGIGNATSIHLLRLAVFVFGFGGGAINGATNALVSLISDTNKVANLSLLGVFYGIGGLGMPLVLSSLSKVASPEQIVTFVSVLALVIGLILLMLRYPPPLQSTPISLRQAASVFKSKLALLITAFLFLQMSLEAIVNNWTTSYLTGFRGITEENALLGLSFFVGGITLMRIVVGGVWRNASEKTLMITALLLLLIGSLSFLQHSVWLLYPGLILFGAGIAIGFPLMLGMIGSLFQEIAGTAFSVVIVIGLLGNLGLNYLMGFIAEHYGIQYFSTAILVIWILMVIFSFLIFNKNSNSNKKIK